ncbi:MAG: peptide chain release factor 1 [Betaproteobacteria bacterium]|nr:peptide chain release factor 1 [Betaproteobacteria bacterium]
MKKSIQHKLEQLSDRIAEIDALLAAEDATRQMEVFTRLSRERSDIEPVVTLYAEYRNAERDMRHAEEMLGFDPELRELAQEEIKTARTRLPQIESELQRLLLPKDTHDEGNVVLEVRAGTGGEESALFAGALLRMYCRLAERRRWQVEIVSATESDLGGYREAIARVVGHGVYAQLKFESGGHRVQRVPETEAQGRIHTSACTVAVLPEAGPQEDLVINPAELRIDTFRASGAGGQHINKTESAVRITHLPTGIVVECQDGRSQHQNREQAMRVLGARIMDAQQRARHEKEAAHRKSLIGSGDRSERIRTYNFPQGRVTDHRINLTLYKIDAIMDGDMDELLTALATEYQTEQLAALADEA